MTSTSAIPTKPNRVILSATPKNDIGGGIDREEMISVAAYYHAEHRDFGGGDPLADWLAAEAEIDAMHKNHKDINVQEQAN